MKKNNNNINPKKFKINICFFKKSTNFKSYPKMANLSLQQKVNDYMTKNKIEKRKSDSNEPIHPHHDYSEIKDRLPEELKLLIDEYRQKAGFLKVKNIRNIDNLIMYRILKSIRFLKGLISMRN